MVFEVEYEMVVTTSELIELLQTLEGDSTDVNCPVCELLNQLDSDNLCINHHD
ncbi:MAG: hypothetical protein GF309_14180 [Candidatus Lokiarchaeota archaeon]|nr:hypothetical protein [Candidatus Lokiarchaeota archaeon]